MGEGKKTMSLTFDEVLTLRRALERYAEGSDLAWWEVDQTRKLDIWLKDAEQVLLCLPTR